MNNLTIAYAIRHLTQLNIKILSRLPLNDEDRQLLSLANQIAEHEELHTNYTDHGPYATTPWSGAGGEVSPTVSQTIPTLEHTVANISPTQRTSPTKRTQGARAPSPKLPQPTIALTVPTMSRQNPSIQQDGLPGFSQCGKNSNYTSYTSIRHKIRYYNCIKYAGHLARILVESGSLGRYDALKERLDVEVGPTPINPSDDVLQEWVERVGHHVGASISLAILRDNGEIAYYDPSGTPKNDPFWVLYYNDRFYQIVQTHDLK